jgi:hypothetical protein
LSPTQSKLLTIELLGREPSEARTFILLRLQTLIAYACLGNEDACIRWEEPKKGDIESPGGDFLSPRSRIRCDHAENVFGSSGSRNRTRVSPHRL